MHVKRCKKVQERKANLDSHSSMTANEGGQPDYDDLVPDVYTPFDHVQVRQIQEMSAGDSWWEPHLENEEITFDFLPNISVEIPLQDTDTPLQDEVEEGVINTIYAIYYSRCAGRLNLHVLPREHSLVYNR
jgi:hypothetical protein